MAESESKNTLLPVIPLRDIVVFPNMVVPLFVGRDKSINALEEAVRKNIPVIVVTQKNPKLDNPATDDFFPTATLANVMQLLRLPDNTVKVLAEIKSRVNLEVIFEDNDYLSASYKVLRNKPYEAEEIKPKVAALIKAFDEYVKLNNRIPQEIIGHIAKLPYPSDIADSIASNIVLTHEEKHGLLKEIDIHKRVQELLGFVEREIFSLSAEHNIRSKVKEQIEENNKKYYLREQMKILKRELGEEADNEAHDDEVLKLKDKAKKLKFTKDAKELFGTEIKKLSSMSMHGQEASIIRTFLDFLTDLPWGKNSRVNKDLAKAESILDKQHSGLKKVKERVIEHLAVQNKTGSLKGPILCLVGPPGVGKTSLAKSIAEACKREYQRIALGGVRDEAEVRGHRRTYLGAMPGKIIKAISKAKVSNPLILLDEIDKMGFDQRGDPASALLEVLDPEQNKDFQDHYLETGYDLSNVMFITTANSLNIPSALRDRLEIIQLSGYTEDEKVEIATTHLIPKQLKEHGLKGDDIEISEKVLRETIQKYTRESGVRNLERQIGTLMRKVVTEIVKGDSKKVSLKVSDLADYLGVPKFEYSSKDTEARVGITNGLAYMESGGDLLPIEAAVIKAGSGKIAHTGKLGDVMQESAQVAWSFVRSRADEFGIKEDDFRKNDIHIHVPEGATPKDGPSAGIALSVSIVSALTGKKVRNDVAMTGEISLRGAVLPIGGLKEKLLAALRGDIKTVIIPKKNEKDLAELPKNVTEGLEIILAEKFDEVIANAIVD